MSVVDDFKLHVLKNIQGAYKQVLSADLSKEEKNDFVTSYWKIRSSLGSLPIEGKPIERIYDVPEEIKHIAGNLTNDTTSSQTDESTTQTEK
jgi:hypothetical protein